MLSQTSSNLPAPQIMRTTSRSLFDLAPDGVCKFFKFLQRIVVSYTTVSPLPEGGILSAALSMNYNYSLTLLGSILFCGARTFLY